MTTEYEKELIKNWKIRHNNLGIKRYKLEGLIDIKRYKIKRLIAKLRKNKIIYLYKRNYFINIGSLKELGLSEDNHSQGNNLIRKRSESASQEEIRNGSLRSASDTLNKGESGK